MLSCLWDGDKIFLSLSDDYCESLVGERQEFSLKQVNIYTCIQFSSNVPVFLGGMTVGDLTGVVRTELEDRLGDGDIA